MKCASDFCSVSKQQKLSVFFFEMFYRFDVYAYPLAAIYKYPVKIKLKLN